MPMSLNHLVPGFRSHDWLPVLVYISLDQEAETSDFDLWVCPNIGHTTIHNKTWGNLMINTSSLDGICFFFKISETHPTSAKKTPNENHHFCCFTCSHCSHCRIVPWFQGPQKPQDPPPVDPRSPCWGSNAPRSRVGPVQPPLGGWDSPCPPGRFCSGVLRCQLMEMEIFSLETDVFDLLVTVWIQLEMVIWSFLMDGDGFVERIYNSMVRIAWRWRLGELEMLCNVWGPKE